MVSLLLNPLMCCCGQGSAAEVALGGNIQCLDQQSVIGSKDEVNFANNTALMKIGKPPAPSLQRGSEISIFIGNVGPDTPGLGLDVDITDGPTLLIDAVREGLVQQWNSENPAIQVKPHDRIIDVNGIRGESRDIIEEMSCAPSLTMLLRRPTEFFVSVRKQGEVATLGLELSYCAGGSTLLVVDVREGLIEKWNKSCVDKSSSEEDNATNALNKGDRVVEVNGRSGNAKELFDLLIQSDSLVLKCMKALGSLNEVAR